MKNFKRNGIVLGLGVLGIGTLIGMAQPASAAPGHVIREERRDVRQAHREVIRDQRNLRQERRQLNQARNNSRNNNYARTVEGTVTQDLKGQDFLLRANNGQQYRVMVPGGEPGSLSKGDLVRASGYFSAGSFRASHVSILRNR